MRTQAGPRTGRAHPRLGYYVPGDERVPVRTPADLVGRYRSVLNDEVLTIYVDSGELMMRSNHTATPVAWGSAATADWVSTPASRAGLVRRRGRMMLHILWCYRWGALRE